MKKIEQRQYDCPRLRAITHYSAEVETVNVEEFDEPIRIVISECASKDRCGIRTEDGGYDWRLCPAHINVERGGRV